MVASKAASLAQYSSDEEILGPKGSPVTKAKISQLLHSPSHVRLKRRVLVVAYIGVAGCGLTLLVIALSCWFGYKILEKRRWFIYLYVGSGVMNLIWAVFGMMYMKDVRTLQDPAWLQIDFCQMMVCWGASTALLFYIFKKNLQYADRTLFNAACNDAAGCSTSRFYFYQYSSLITAIMLVLIGVVQTVFYQLIYKDPIVNPVSPFHAPFRKTAQQLKTPHPPPSHFPKAKLNKEELPDYVPPGSSRSSTMTAPPQYSDSDPEANAVAMSPTVYLISGANRGIGFTFVSYLATRPNVVIYAGARDPSTATALKALSDAHPGVIHIIKLVSASAEDAQAAASAVEKAHGKVDVVIANAGIIDDVSGAATVSLGAMKTHFEVNTLGPLVLFQATHSLLTKSDGGAPKFVLVASTAGSLGMNLDMHLSAYGTSKAAANFLLGKMHNEHKEEGLVVLALHPGLTSSDMGNRSAQMIGLPHTPQTLDESVSGMLKLIDSATRGDQVAFLDFQGEAQPW
ncbi:short-chain dehydrogenase/reductase SDR family protein [Pseudohyphozyma bogoriensis]|nr:short-chain dehydrogenase/reductase SDR family protein [Pseudohyphozyma bogoriensis]